MITRDDILRLAKSRGIKPRQEYIDALMAGIEDLRAAGILDSAYRISHFMAQVAHETGGFTIIRESLSYRSAARLRAVWPARFRNKSDAELRHLVRNPVALGDAVYGGRMGNRDPGDGYTYRGGGFIQTTGRSAVETYAKALGLEPSPNMLDDLGLTLKFACLEWKEANCCTWADENDLVKVSKAINTGSATSNIRPVGLDDRRKWFAQAWSIWGERGTPDDWEKPPMPTEQKTLIATAATAVGGVTVASVGEGVQVAKQAKDLAPPIDSLIWPAAILVGGLILSLVIFKRWQT